MVVRAPTRHIAPRVHHTLCTHTHTSYLPLVTHVSPVTLSPVTHVHPRLRHAALSVTCMLPAASVARSSRPPRRARRPSRLVVHSLLMSHIVVLSGPSAPLRPPAPRVVRRIGRCAAARVRSPPPPSCLPPPPHRIACGGGLLVVCIGSLTLRTSRMRFGSCRRRAPTSTASCRAR